MKTIMRSLYHFLILAVLSAGLPFGSADSTNDDRPVRLACAGDSNTKKGYPQILQTMLENQGWHDVTAENYGIGAATILDGTLRPYVESDEYESLTRSAPDVVIVMLGTNDANPDYWDARDGPSEEFRRRYFDLLETLRGLESHPQIVIATPLSIYPERAGPPHRDNMIVRKEHLIKDVIPLIRGIAAEAALPLVDVYGHMEGEGSSSSSASLSHDGVHFNRAGYRRMCRAFVAALSKLDL